jgi:hypothetical protein
MDHTIVTLYRYWIYLYSSVYTYIVRKKLFVQALETGRKASIGEPFCLFSQSVQVNYIFSDNVTLLNLIPVYLQAIHTDSGYCVLLTVRLKLYSWSTVHSLKILTSFWFLWEQFWIRTYFWFSWICTVIVEMAERAVRKMCLRCLLTFIYSCWLKK